MYEVEKINYSKLVKELEKACDIGVYLEEKTFRELKEPVWQNELFYFWIALAKAARESEIVSSWFKAQPHLRHLMPDPETAGQLVDKLVLPEIGGADDKPFVKPEKKDSRPSRYSGEDFEKEIEHLAAIIRDRAGNGPDLCQNIEEWVNEFAPSGAGQAEARSMLQELGFPALATNSGMLYLIKKYFKKKIISK